MQITFTANTALLEDRLRALAKAVNVAPGVVIKEEARGILRQVIALTPPGRTKQDAEKKFWGIHQTSGLAMGRAAIKGDLFGGKRAKRYLSIGLFQRIGSSKLVPPRKLGREGQTVGVSLGWENGKRIRIYRKFWRPDAGIAEMTAFHKRYQNPRTGRTGRVSQSTIGRWKVQDQMWVSDSSANRYLKHLQDRVGWAKGGWAAGLIATGDRPPNWIARHAAAAGTVRPNFGTNPFFYATARAIKIPNYQRMVDTAVMTRERITQRKIDRIIAGKAVNLGFMVVEART